MTTEATAQNPSKSRSRLLSYFSKDQYGGGSHSSAHEKPVEVCRQGKKELGKYAFETRMPAWLHAKLEREDQKSAANAPTLVPALASLLDRDDSVEKAHLCHPSVRYIGKIKGEGNHFCGYRNIQMLMTYLMDVRPDSLRKLKGRIPSVLELQDMIEDGWARGMNAYGLIQTGGIRGTRKHIGTPEAQGMFRNQAIDLKGARFQGLKGGKRPYEQLLDYVEKYFKNTPHHPRTHAPQLPITTKPPTITTTAQPPIYLQRPHHSMTIVGIESKKNGSRNLLVFDPAYNPSKQVASGATENPDPKHAHRLLRPYRRGRRQLKRYHAFETLTLRSMDPTSS